MKAHGVADQAFIYIADAAMVTEENLAQAGLFITRLPATYNECERVILRTIEADQWSEVERIARTAPSENRPVASYRVHEEPVTLYDKEYRAVVVHSSAHDKRRQKRLERELDASLKAIKARAKASEKRWFFCRADAEAAADAILAIAKQLERNRLAPLLPVACLKGGCRPADVYTVAFLTILCPVSERVYLRDFDLQQLDEQKLKELPSGAKRGAAGEVAVGSGAERVALGGADAIEPDRVFIAADAPVKAADPRIFA
jgi:hypothetical protein